MILYLILSGIAAGLVAVFGGVPLDHLFTFALRWAAAAAGLSVLQWLFVEIVAGHASRNRALRPVSPPPEQAANRPQDVSPPDPGPSVSYSACWYIETPHRDNSRPTSCSFVEFDERGDYLDFWQHRHAYEKILSLARNQDPLTVVVYVHGWRHNGQSHDVLAFNHFLEQMNAAEARGRVPRRIHGVYLAWRGAALKPVVPEDDAFKVVREAYGGRDIISPQYRARLPWLTDVLETFSYFDRKSVPEHKFSGTQLSRTVFSCAFAAKRNTTDCQVLLLGHSFGGLMLERTVQNAAIGELTASWRWGEEGQGTSVNPLPFDTILIVNSAAPSIYAKQFQSYLAAHRQAMADAGVSRANTPFVFSLTSAADWATGITHPIANGLSFLAPSLRRQYSGGDFTLERVGDFEDARIPQYYYYQHTPGHNPLLVNRFIEGLPSSPTGTDVPWRQIHRNLAPRPVLTEFDTTSKDGTSQRWRIAFPPKRSSVDDAFSRYGTRRPVVWTQVPPGSERYRYKETAYWIVRCPKEIIAGHNDIWSQAAMDTYAALHRISL